MILTFFSTTLAGTYSFAHFTNIYMLSLRDINLLIQDHTVRMRFKSKSLECKFSSISSIATFGKPNFLKKNSTLSIGMRRSSRDSWLKHRESQRNIDAYQNHLEGLFFLSGTPHPTRFSYTFLRHHVPFSWRESHLRCTPALLMCADVYWYCVLPFICVATGKKFENYCLGRRKTLGNAKPSVAKSYKGFRALDRAWMHQERF